MILKDPQALFKLGQQIETSTRNQKRSAGIAARLTCLCRCAPTTIFLAVTVR